MMTTVQSCNADDTRTIVKRFLLETNSYLYIQLLQFFDVCSSNYLLQYLDSNDFINNIFSLPIYHVVSHGLAV